MEVNYLLYALAYGLIPALNAQTSASPTCQNILALFPFQVSFPSSLSYQFTNRDYWDVGCILAPSCIVFPETADNLADTIKRLVQDNQTFAVKSGGHLANPGFNNVNDGVLISMERLQTLNWLEEDSVVQVGAGLTWGDLYSSAAKRDKYVVGGRISPIGIPGLILGGGLSYIGPRYGFACDNVKSFEVVLANGSIIYADQKTHADLFRALKGGSSIFGLVTRFDLIAYDTAGSWGGMIRTPINSLVGPSRDRVLKVVGDFHTSGSTDSRAGFVPSFMKIPALGLEIFMGSMFYSVPSNTTPDVFVPVLELEGLQSTGSITLAELAEQAGEGAINGINRNTFHTASLLATEQSIIKVEEAFRDAFRPLENLPGLITVLTLQPIPSSFVQAGNNNGGNVMGLDSSRAPYTWVSQSVAWANSEDDVVIKQAQRNASSTYMRWARENGLDDRYLYLNDADESQDVFSSYGIENVLFMERVRKSYDSKGVFTRLMPGGYKILQ